MKIRQLSLFLENRPAQASSSRAVAGPRVALTSGPFGGGYEAVRILRMIVSDGRKPTGFLRRRWVVNVTEVVAIEVPDPPAGCARSWRS